MKILSFNADSDRLVVVKKSKGEMTVVIKLKNADKESEKNMNFTRKRLVDVYKLRTRVFLVHIFRVFHTSIFSVPVFLFLNNVELLRCSFVVSDGRASVSCWTTSTRKSQICVLANLFSTEITSSVATYSRSPRGTSAWTFASSACQKERPRRDRPDAE